MSALKIGQILENQALDFWYRLRPYSSPPPEISSSPLTNILSRILKRPGPGHAAITPKSSVNLKLPGLASSSSTSCLPNRAIQRMTSYLPMPSGRRETSSWQLPLNSARAPRSPARFWSSRLRLSVRRRWDMGLTLVTPDSDGIVRRFHCHLGDEDTLPKIVAQHYRPNLVIPPTSAASFISPVPPDTSRPSPTAACWRSLSRPCRRIFMARSSSSVALWGPRRLPWPTPFTRPSLPRPANSCPGWKSTRR